MQGGPQCPPKLLESWLASSYPDPPSQPEPLPDPKGNGRWPQASYPHALPTCAPAAAAGHCHLAPLLHLLHLQVTGTGSSEKPTWSPGTHSPWSPMDRASPMTASTRPSGGNPQGTPSSSVGTGEWLWGPPPCSAASWPLAGVGMVGSGDPCAPHLLTASLPQILAL